MIIRSVNITTTVRQRHKRGFDGEARSKTGFTSNKYLQVPSLLAVGGRPNTEQLCSKSWKPFCEQCLYKNAEHILRPRNMEREQEEELLPILKPMHIFQLNQYSPYRVSHLLSNRIQPDALQTGRSEHFTDGWNNIVEENGKWRNDLWASKQRHLQDIHWYCAIRLSCCFLCLPNAQNPMEKRLQPSNRNFLVVTLSKCA